MGRLDDKIEFTEKQVERYHSLLATNTGPGSVIAVSDIDGGSVTQMTPANLEKELASAELYLDYLYALRQGVHIYLERTEVLCAAY